MIPTSALTSSSSSLSTAEIVTKGTLQGRGVTRSDVELHVAKLLREAIPGALPVDELFTLVGAYSSHPVSDMMQRAKTNEELCAIAKSNKGLPETRLDFSRCDVNSSFWAQGLEPIKIKTIQLFLENFPMVEEIDLRNSQVTAETVSAPFLAQACPHLRKLHIDVHFEPAILTHMPIPDHPAPCLTELLAKGIQIHIDDNFIDHYFEDSKEARLGYKNPVLLRMIETGSWSMQDLMNIYCATLTSADETVHRTFRTMLFSPFCRINDTRSKYEKSTLLHQVCWAMKKNEDLELVLSHPEVYVNGVDNSDNTPLDIIEKRISTFKEKSSPQELLHELQKARSLLLSRGASNYVNYVYVISPEEVQQSRTRLLNSLSTTLIRNILLAAPRDAEELDTFHSNLKKSLDIIAENTMQMVRQSMQTKKLPRHIGLFEEFFGS